MHELMQVLLTTTSLETHHAFLGALIGGLLGRSQAKKNARLMAEAAKVPLVTSHKVDLEGMNKAAIDAGYNPMTVLNAGGMAGWTTTTQTGHNAMAAAQAAGAVPSVGSVFAGALSGTIDALAGAAFKAVAPMSRDYYPPAPSKSGGMAQALGWTGGTARAGGAASPVGATYTAAARLGTLASGAPQYPEIEQPKTQNPYRMFHIDPTDPGAAAMEERLGDSELASMVAFGLTGFNDLLYNVTGTTSEERYNRFTKPLAQAAANSFDSIKAGIMSRARPEPKDAYKSVGKEVFNFFEPWMAR